MKLQNTSTFVKSLLDMDERKSITWSDVDYFNNKEKRNSCLINTQQPLSIQMLKLTSKSIVCRVFPKVFSWPCQSDIS